MTAESEDDLASLPLYVPETTPDPVSRPALRLLTHQFRLQFGVGLVIGAELLAIGLLFHGSMASVWVGAVFGALWGCSTAYRVAKEWRRAMTDAPRVAHVVGSRRRIARILVPDRGRYVSREIRYGAARRVGYVLVAAAFAALVAAASAVVAGLIVFMGATILALAVMTFALGSRSLRRVQRGSPWRLLGARGRGRGTTRYARSYWAGRLGYDLETIAFVPAGGPGSGSPTSVEALPAVLRQTLLFYSGRIDEAIVVGLLAHEEQPGPSVAYLVACSMAQAGRDDEAIEWLERAASSGLANARALRSSPSLARIRHRPEMAAIRFAVRENRTHARARRKRSSSTR